MMVALLSRRSGFLVEEYELAKQLPVNHPKYAWEM